MLAFKIRKWSIISKRKKKRLYIIKLYLIFNRKECFCSDNYGSQGSSANCNMGCSGNVESTNLTVSIQETCGGPNANSIYMAKGVYFSFLKGLVNFLFILKK